MRKSVLSLWTLLFLMGPSSWAGASIPWKLGDDFSELSTPAWCEGQQLWQDGSQGQSVLVADCLKKVPAQTCENVTIVRLGKLFSTAQCVSR